MIPQTICSPFFYTLWMVSPYRLHRVYKAVSARFLSGYSDLAAHRDINGRSVTFNSVLYH